MKTWILAAALLVAVSTASAAEMQVLWDQAAHDPSGAGGLRDAAAGCPPGADTIHLASDFRLDSPVSIERVTTFYTATAPESFAATAEAWLWIAPKRGDLPAAADDPRAAGRLVPVRTQRAGNGFALIAADLAVPLRPGEYWISLTPVVPLGPHGTERHLPAVRPWGRPSAGYDPCGTHRWTVQAAGSDATVKIEGVVREPAGAAAGGGGPWLWRAPR